MNYKIEHIEKLILHENPEEKEDIETVLQELYAEIKSEIRNEIYCKKSIKESKLFIYNHFSTLLYYSKLLNQKQKENDNETYRIIQKYLNLFFTFLLNRFSEYINPETEVPFCIMTGIASEYNSKAKELIDLLQAKKIDKKLIELLYSKYNQMYRTKITFRRLQYMKHIYEKLKQDVATKSDSINTDSIIKMLYLENFNSIDFIQYITEYIKAELKARKSIQGKIAKLVFIKKQYFAVQVTTKLKYNYNLPCIMKMVKSLLKEEKRNLQLEQEKSKNAEIIEKISTSLSVEQLCVFFRLLNETKILYHQNHTETFKFISNHLKTNNTVQISQASIKSKYYCYDIQVYNTLKGKIIEMLNKLKNNNKRW